MKTRVRELEEEVGEIWVVPLKMLILGLLRLTIMAIKALLTKYLVPKLFQSTTYIPCKWKPKVEKLRGRAKKLAEMLEVVRSQVFHKEKNSPIHLSFFLDLIKFPFNLLFHYLLSGRRNVLEEVWLS